MHLFSLTQQIFSRLSVIVQNKYVGREASMPKDAPPGWAPSAADAGQLICKSTCSEDLHTPVQITADTGNVVTKNNYINQAL